MHAAGLKYVIQTAKAHKDPVAKAVCAACEVGVVVPSILRANLEAAGYRVEDEKLKHLHAVQIFAPRKPTKNDPAAEELVAQGTSGDAADALLHAVRGYLLEREKEAPADKPKKK